MYLYSELLPTFCPGYKINEEKTILVDTARTINYKKLMEILLSKDENLLKEN